MMGDVYDLTDRQERTLLALHTHGGPDGLVTSDRADLLEMSRRTLDSLCKRRLACWLRGECGTYDVQYACGWALTPAGRDHAQHLMAQAVKT